MSEPPGEPHYRPPVAALEATPPRRRAGVLRAALGAATGFGLDVLGTQLLGLMLIYAFFALVPAGNFPSMNFYDWAGSLQNPWALADLAISTGMSVLGGYIAARIAHGREGVAFGLVAFLHVFWSVSPDEDLGALLTGIDGSVLLQVTALNWGATLFGMWLRRRELHALDTHAIDNHRGTA